MNKINHIKTALCLLSITGLYTSSSFAGVVNGTHWVIEPGDTLYKIARSIYPGDSGKQQQLRRAVITENPQIFQNNANSISVGDKLQLPSFAFAKKELVSPTTPNPVAKKSIITKKIETIADTPETKITPANTTSKRNPKEVIGQVVINVGELTAENRGAKRLLNRRSKVLRGDTISTGAQSHTQIRLKDGALLSLRPYTNLKIADYRYNGRQDGTEQSIIELLKGGFRTITGAIGHINKQTYKVKTSVATIGIRGTHYSLMLCDDNCRDDAGKKVKAGLYGGVSDGAVVIENQTGIHRFNNDQFFQIISSRAKPIEFLKPPGILKTRPRELAKTKEKFKKIKHKISEKIKAHHRRTAVIFEPNQPELAERPPLPVAGLDPDTTPVNVIEPIKAPNGSAMLIGFNHLDGDGFESGTAAPVIASTATNNEILIKDFTLPDETVVGKVPYAATEYSDVIDPVTQTVTGTVKHQIAMISPTGTPAVLDPSSIGGDPTLGVNWGRWNGEYTALEDGQKINTSNDFHYIYSENLTTPARLSQLTGTSAYNITGGTSPTDNLGNVALTGTSVSMNVSFDNAEISSYSASTTINSINYQADASNIPFADLSRSFNLTGTSCTSCTGEASVVFVGDVAQGALNSYQIQNSVTGTSATGTALLTGPGGTVQ